MDEGNKSGNLLGKELKAKLLGMNPNPIITLNISDVQDVVRIEVDESGYIQAKPAFRLLKGTFQKDPKKVVIKTNRFDQDFGVAILAAKEIRREELENSTEFEEWRGFVSEKDVRIVAEEKYSIEPGKFFGKINHEEWVQCVKFLTDETATKSEEITRVCESAVVIIPEYRLDLMRRNNHSYLQTTSGTGKTETIKNLTGVQPTASRSTEAGLKGSVDLRGKITQGVMNGSGLFAFDEIDKRTKEDEHLVAQFADYMSSGEDKRVMRPIIHFKGTKTLFFLGNISPESVCEEGFKSAFSKLIDYYSFEMAARRIGLYVFGIFNRVSEEKIEAELEESFPRIKNLIRQQISSVCLHNKKALSLMYDAFFNSFNSEKYEEVRQLEDEYLKSLGEIYELSERVSEGTVFLGFLKGLSHSQSYNRVKMAAFRRTLLYHLDDIQKGVDPAEFVRLNFKEIFENYKYFLNMNVQSFYTMLDLEGKENFTKVKDFVVKKYLSSTGGLPPLNAFMKEELKELTGLKDTRVKKLYSSIKKLYDVAGSSFADERGG
jgi:hypothetical protein